MSRPSWDSYFMQMAQAAAGRSTCDRAHVGCVLVDSQRNVVATGYNGSVPGLPHCDELGHLLIDGHCVRTIHAEQNALLRAGRAAWGTTCYVTHYPCLTCAKLLAAAGSRRVVYAQSYRPHEITVALFASASIVITHYEEHL